MSVPFATRLPEDLIEAVDVVCDRLGLRKNALVEAALREKLEDLLDAEDLREAIREETRFHSWKNVRPRSKSRQGR